MEVEDGFEDQILQLLERAEPIRAIELIQIRLQNEQNNSSLWNLLAQARHCNGNLPLAKEALEKCIQLSPDDYPDAFLSLAQLYRGQEARQLYERAIQILAKQIQQLPRTEEEQITEFKKNCSDAYIAISELYMTDLCDEPDAEEMVQQTLSAAKEMYSGNVEALLTECQYFTIIGNFESAKQNIQQSLAHLPNPDSFSDFDLYTRLIKLCLDCDENNTALTVVESCIRAQDDIPEIWALGAVGLLNLNKASEAVEFLTNAKQLATRMEDEGTLQMVNEIVKTIQNNKKEAAVPAQQTNESMMMQSEI